MVHFGIFGLFFTFTLRTVLVPLGTAGEADGLQTDGKDRPRVVGASQPIVAAQGDDVILPCHVEPQLDVEEMKVDWFRPDVPPDPADPQSNYRYVHRYHDKHHEEDMKNPSYAGRTEMFPDGLKHGNISLKIRDVRRSDRGLYSCQVPHLGSAAVITLNVEPRYVETTEKPRPPSNPSTPGPNPETGEGGRRHLRVPVLFAYFVVILDACVILILVACITVIMGRGLY
ncbi:uncharacterized protein LOC117962051 [Etheostoma cragini]|uniref:uncharacterized protein LOC117962051 n=1 Tax=Etheostoma cragini TaxID=417921 RepID=UPI00155E1948|nr:uncharacterized protein LOC117962051 [Etheostoma cragini]